MSQKALGRRTATPPVAARVNAPTPHVARASSSGSDVYAAPVAAPAPISATPPVASPPAGGSPALSPYDSMDPFLLPPPTQEMGVANMTFLLERLYMDCAPGQFVREFTKNALQALEALRNAQSGFDAARKPVSKSRAKARADEEVPTHDAGDETAVIVWTVWDSPNGVPKLAILDNGIGMTARELMENINRLAAGNNPQGHQKNYGVGGKISAAPRNKAGILYFSWKRGEPNGVMAHLWYDEDANKYGLKQLNVGGRYQSWAPVTNAAKPKEIGDHGTMVVFLGNEDDEDTSVAPAGLPSPKRWLYRYLTGRFHRFPSGMKVRVNYTRDEKDRRVVTPFEEWLLKNAEARDTVELTGAKAHWFIMKPDTDTSGGHYPTLGVVGALWQDELYDMVSGPAAAGRLHAFGIVFELRRVAIIIEPLASTDTLTSDTARTRLLIGGEGLPWADWAAEFRGKTPHELDALQEGAAAKADVGNVRQNIIQRLQNLSDLFKLPRYRRLRAGTLVADPESLDEAAGGAPRSRRPRPDEPEVPTPDIDNSNGEPFEPPTMTATTRRRRRADFYSALVADPANGGVAVQEADAVEKAPDIKWISVLNGTREKGDLEDLAARFVPERNLLQVNEDFRVFQDTVSRYADQYPDVAAARKVVLEIAREWYSQQLVEVVVAARALADGNPNQWTYDRVEKLWSEEALTAAVLARSHIETMVKRWARNKLGPTPSARAGE